MSGSPYTTKDEGGVKFVWYWVVHGQCWHQTDEELGHLNQLQQKVCTWPTVQKLAFRYLISQFGHIKPKRKERKWMAFMSMFFCFCIILLHKMSCQINWASVYVQLSKSKRSKIDHVLILSMNAGGSGFLLRQDGWDIDYHLFQLLPSSRRSVHIKNDFDFPLWPCLFCFLLSMKR